MVFKYFIIGAIGLGVACRLSIPVRYKVNSII